MSTSKCFRFFNSHILVGNECSSHIEDNKDYICFQANLAGRCTHSSLEIHVVSVAPLMLEMNLLRFSIDREPIET